jgi:hypothetical protein
VPLFIDVHESMPEGATLADVAAAHQADLATQGEYGVNYRSYWVDEVNRQIFCLVEAPDADAAVAVHRLAHGLIADHIHPVVEGL